MAVAGLAIGYISIMLWLILITPILGVAISKLGNTTTVAKLCAFKRTSRQSRRSCNCTRA